MLTKEEIFNVENAGLKPWHGGGRCPDDVPDRGKYMMRGDTRANFANGGLKGCRWTHVDNLGDIIGYEANVVPVETVMILKDRSAEYAKAVCCAASDRKGITRLEARIAALRESAEKWEAVIKEIEQ
jgi:hypothetical protein